HLHHLFWGAHKISHSRHFGGLSGYKICRRRTILVWYIGTTSGVPLEKWGTNCVFLHRTAVLQRDPAKSAHFTAEIVLGVYDASANPQNGAHHCKVRHRVSPGTIGARTGR